MGQRSAVLVVLVVFASVSCLTRDLLLPREGKLWGVGFFAHGIDLKTLGRMPQTLRGYVVTILDSLSCWHKKLSSYSKNTCPICDSLI